MTRITRRQVLKGMIVAAGAAAASGGRLFLPELLAHEKGSSASEAQPLGIVEFAGEAAPVMERISGGELDGRLFTELSALTADNRVTPTEKFYIRTCASRLLPDAQTWKLRLNLAESGNLVRVLGFDELRAMEQPCGLHLMECSGNGPFTHFGMMSVAEWAGVPLLPLLESSGIARPARRILVSGFDTYQGRSSTSVPGASWVFSHDDLISSRAFLATSMNRQPLTRNHGAPVRLVVPGWYGCCCIKWVNEISAVRDDVPATSQMREFASRTHQAGIPVLAREYSPAIIDPAAMPIRVEKWLVEGRIQYRVVGITWGARPAAGGWEIQLGRNEPFVPLATFFASNDGGWSIWSHTWTPARPGLYSIRLRLNDRSVRTRRLDLGSYERSVVIHDIGS